MNHSLASRVAARPQPKPAAPPPMCSSTLRHQLRSRGAEFESLCRGCVGRVVAALPATPEPRMLYADLQRGRPASLTTFGAALAGASRSPNAAAELDAVADLVAAWIRGLAQHPEAGLLDVWSDETRAQGEADLDLAQALVAPCVGSIDRALVSTSRHVAAQQQLLVRLQDTRRRRAARAGVNATGVRS